MAKAKKAVEKDENDEIVEIGIDVSETISTIRLKQVVELFNDNHKLYSELGTYNKRSQDLIMERIITRYIPNLMQAMPGLLGKLAIQAKYIQALKIEARDLKAQKDKAYKYLGWTLNDYFDVADAFPDDPSEIDLEDYEDILRSATSRKKASKTKAKPKARSKVVIA